jgi:uncharacterized YigZ family protein
VAANKVGEDAYYEPLETAQTRSEIKRSVFIATLRKVASTAEVKDALKAEREEQEGASSIAYAFIIGPPLSETAGMSDGGEPKGTAGRPILEVLRGSGIRNALLTVTRYYGGIKLGTGGLVHAFGGGAKDVLAQAKRKIVRAETNFSVKLGYEYYESFKREFSRLNSGGRILNEDFGEDVRLLLRLPDEAEAGLRVLLRDLTKGKGRMEMKKGGSE